MNYNQGYEIPFIPPVQLQLPLKLDPVCEAFVAGIKLGHSLSGQYTLNEHVIHKELRKYLETPQQEMRQC